MVPRPATAVQCAGGISTPDPHTGERVCAVVVPVSGDAVSIASLRQHCRSSGLSHYKWHERLMLVDVLPCNQFGKVLKKDLRERFGWHGGPLASVVSINCAAGCRMERLTHREHVMLGAGWPCSRNTARVGAVTWQSHTVKQFSVFGGARGEPRSG
nr:hypothetical protein [Mycobacterium malmoense]